jgi:hypothetical protein
MQASAGISPAATWQAMPTSETVYSTMEAQNINDSNDVLSIPAATPTAIYLVTATLTFTAADTEENDVVSCALAISKNGELIGGSLSGQSQGRQDGAILFAGSGAGAIQVVSAQRVVSLDATDTVQGVILVENEVGNPSPTILNYVITIERLS